MNYWDNLMGTDEGAANYMESYGEGPGCETRYTIGSFINEGESVLDVGCGPGWNWDHFQAFGPRVDYKGLDYSERFVRVANERLFEKSRFLANSTRVPRLFAVGDARNITEPDNSWDVVILQDVLEHTNGYKVPISEALRVAKKRVIISFWHLVANDNEHINDDGDDGYGAWYNGDEFEKFLDSLELHWIKTESTPQANRPHIFYVIDREQSHGV